MRKYGKYEKRPEAVPAKKPEVKSMFLQTYFTSLLCLVLCVSMFLGTSYAWFTSEVENEGNEIFIGTLDVGLYKQVPDGNDADDKPDVVSLAKDNTGVNTNKLFDDTVRWEPGYTAVETIQIVNEGDLAFKYELTFTDGTLAAGSTLELEKVAENFDIWVYDYYDNNNAAPNPKAYEDISTANKWDYVGTLAEVLAGKAVITGNMETVRQDDKPDDETTRNGTADGVKTIDTYTIALHMREDTKDASLMGQKISLTVKLVAYQKAQEEDAFGKNYDDTVIVDTEEELVEALKKGGKVVLDKDLTVTEELVVDGTSNVELDLNGHKLKREERPIKVDGDAKLVLKNGTVETDGFVLGLFGNGQIYAENVIFKGADGFCMNGSTTTENSSAEFVNCEFRITSGYNAAYISAKGTYTFKDCVLEGGAGILIRSGTVVLDGCTIIANGYLGKDKVQPDVYANYVVTADSVVKSGVEFWDDDKQDTSTGDCVVIIENSGSGYDLKSVTIKNCTFEVKNSVTVDGQTVPTGYAVRYLNRDGAVVKATLVIENNKDVNGYVVGEGTLGYVYSYYYVTITNP